VRSTSVPAHPFALRYRRDVFRAKHSSSFGKPSRHFEGRCSHATRRPDRHPTQGGRGSRKQDPRTGSDFEQKIGVRSRRPKSVPSLFALDSKGTATPTASPGPSTAPAPLRLTCVQTDIIKEGGLSTYQKRLGARYQSDCTREAQTSSLSDRAEFMQQARS
jgi:hypothetical protein